MNDDKSDAPMYPIESDECRYGPMAWLAHDVYVGKSLKVYGEWCQPEMDLLLTLLQPGDRVIECGSNIGADTVALSKRVGPNGVVLAFEPQPVVYALLTLNLKENDCRNVSAFSAGTSLKDGTLSVPVLDYGSPENFGGVMLGPPGVGRPVKTVKLDTFAGTQEHIALIKADVEGMELPTLLGASGIIGTSRPILYVENNGGPLSAELIRFLQQINYRCWWHVVDLFQPGNFRGAAENVFPNVVCSNMVCLPSGDARIALLPEGLPQVLSPRDLGPTGPRQVRP
jgi:FkbM family methyltransferase